MTSVLSAEPVGEAPGPTAQAALRPTRIVVAATFTAEPLEESLLYWFQDDRPVEVAFAAYNQVFQELLDPASLMARNVEGVNVALVRPLDWVRDLEGGEALVREQVERNTRELIAIATEAAGRSRAPLVVVLPAMPSSPHSELLESAAAELARALEQHGGIYVVTAKEIDALYPVTEKFDPHADRLGHIPFTAPYFTALATIIARRVTALLRPPLKVIAVDCDNTLWKGTIGEDGVFGIVIDEPRQALQRFLVGLSQRGMLICLCSKNEEADVLAALDENPDMILRREHVVSWRVNWQLKSKNLAELAEELGLGIDSFAFLDDNPVECAEVEAACPEVTTLLLPSDDAEIVPFLQHCWELDVLKTTEEDRARTAMYKANVERERARASAPSLDEFIRGLALEIDVAPIESAHLARAAQLTQRTNQFNASTVRRSESELRVALGEGLEGRVISVRDRFGDYGLVGLVLYRLDRAGDALVVDTFLLSCRVLGRRVEHVILSKLIAIAAAAGLRSVRIPYRPSKKNKPFKDFVSTLDAVSIAVGEGAIDYVLPAKVSE